MRPTYFVHKNILSFLVSSFYSTLVLGSLFLYYKIITCLCIYLLEEMYNFKNNLISNLNKPKKKRFIPFSQT